MKNEIEEDLKRVFGDIAIVAATISVILIFSGCQPLDDYMNIPKQDCTTDTCSIPDTPIDSTSTKIANWNLQIFGDSKASNQTLMNIYINKIKQYDIIFIQEIRDEDGSSFADLCGLLPEYQCRISSRAGRSTSKEQYGVIYKNAEIIAFNDYNSKENALDYWERPPIQIIFNVNGHLINIYNIHTKPEDVTKELYYLEGVVLENYKKSIIIGDLNADCSYYNNNEDDAFDSWNWVIPDSADTTVAATDCAYDRILIKDVTIKNWGIDNLVTKDVSDHYLVWVEIT